MDIDTLLSKLETETDLDVLRYIPDKLAKLGDWKSTRPLGEIVVDKSKPLLLRNEAVESLGKQGDPRAVEYLRTAVNDDDDELRRTAVWSLGQIGVLNAHDIIVNLKDDSSKQVRRWIAKSLARISHPQTADFLLDFWGSFPDDEVTVRADILRAAIDFVDLENVDDWYGIAVGVLTSTQEMKLLQPASLMVNACLQLKPDLDIDSIQDLIVQEPDYLSNIRIQLFEALGRARKITFLQEYLETEFSLAIHGIALSGSTNILKDYFTRIYDLNQSDQENLLAAISKTSYLPNTEKLMQLLNSSELSIQLLILEIFAKHKLFYDTLVEFYNQDNGKYKLLELMGNYKQSFDILSDAARNGDKVARKICVEQLCAPLFTQDQNVHDKLRSTFEFVSKNDPIWHIRRDARYGLHLLTSKS